MDNNEINDNMAGEDMAESTDNTDINNDVSGEDMTESTDNTDINNDVSGEDMTESTDNTDINNDVSGEGECEDLKFALENSVLLVLGANKKKISLLLLEKIFFVLKLKGISGYTESEFHSHVMGEYSDQLEDAVMNPEYLKGAWEYTSPAMDDHYSGGHIVLTASGKEMYNESIHTGTDEDFKGYLKNIRAVRKAYNEYSDAGMLMLSYNAFPEYAERSDLYDEIYGKREVIAKKLLKKGRIDKERYRELAVDEWHRWQD
ncbi:hypothetical protein [Methanoplanus endosymbiosus]|uniref:Uncharacterized protein n=1 Tax=Methanoplanus endosymbiosus TaxID=33865 RepID=A0A9E7PPN4_9EURY|nr:hypothetical protein [Methanoplanus endosymbiosus]UUX93167.1 hypothetical protein L6E24_03330 [Methanoplanus endosymbiosus]